MKKDFLKRTMATGLVAAMALAYNSGLQPYKSVRFVRSGQDLKEISGER